MANFSYLGRGEKMYLVNKKMLAEMLADMKILFLEIPRLKKIKKTAPSNNMLDIIVEDTFPKSK